jgi:hypothetical protein
MGHSLRFLDFVEALLIGSHWDTGIAVLSCYYDDSGTHDDSDVVVWAGLFGNKYQWAALDDAWAEALKYTPTNCRPLTHFHMTRCDNGSGEFDGDDKYERWPIPEREKLAKELRRIIDANMMSGFSIGVAKKAWDELVVGDRRRLLGDAEGWAIRQSIKFGIKWAISRQCESDRDLAMFFDKRRIGEVSAVHKAFSESRPLNLIQYHPDVLPVGFSAMSKTRPIQAADLFAWEYYQHCKDVFLDGGGDIPRREQLRELVQNVSGRLAGAVVGEKEIKAMLETAGSDEDYSKWIKQLPKTWNWKVK